jgi:hypothetical protein
MKTPAGPPVAQTAKAQSLCTPELPQFALTRTPAWKRSGAVFPGGAKALWDFKKRRNPTLPSMGNAEYAFGWRTVPKPGVKPPIRLMECSDYARMIPASPNGFAKEF